MKKTIIALLLATCSMAFSEFTEAQVDYVVRKGIAPFEVSLGSPAPTTGITWTASTDNKIVVTVVPSSLPNGFDLFTTAEGPAIRFIGSGLGNGDTARVCVITSFSISVGSGQGVCEFKAKTRPYTEALFANAVDIPYIGVSRNFPNNDVGALALAPQIIEVSDGDLIEFSANPVATFSSVSMQWSGILITEL